MNLPTLIGALVVAGIFLAIVWRSHANKKAGKSSCSCGGDCGCCPNGGACRPQK